MADRRRVGLSTLTLSICGFIAAVAVPLFIWLVAGGWSRVLTDFGLARGGSWWGAILLALLALALAARMGDEHALELVRRDLEANSRKRWNWLWGWIFVFLVSGLGLVTSFFTIAEGGTVLHERLEAAHSALAQMRGEAGRVLGDPIFDRKRARVDGLLTNLESTIQGDNRICGVGRQARGVIRQISELLPDYDFVPVGSDRRYPCGSQILDRFVKEYRDRATQMLDNDAESVTSGGRDRRLLRAEVFSGVDALQPVVTNAENALRSNAAGNGRQQATDALQKASAFYGDHRLRLASLATARLSDDLPRSIEVPTGEETVATIIPTLVVRIGHPTTWGYIIAALLADLGTALLSGQLIYGFRTRRRLADPDSDPWGGRSHFGPEPSSTLQDPAFLWVNPYS